MDIDSVLTTEAEDEATRAQNRARGMEADLLQIETRKREVEAALHSAHSAVHRAVNYRVRLGADYQCPCCWVRDEVRSPLAPVPGTADHDIMRCHTCGMAYTVPLR